MKWDRQKVPEGAGLFLGGSLSTLRSTLLALLKSIVAHDLGPSENLDETS